MWKSQRERDRQTQREREKQRETERQRDTERERMRIAGTHVAGWLFINGHDIQINFLRS